MDDSWDWQRLGGDRWYGERYQCPFCLERGFDAVGLKMHLEVRGWCPGYAEVDIEPKVLDW